MKCRSGIAAIGVAIIGVLVGCGASPVQSSSAPLRPTPTVTKTPTLSYKGTRLTVVPKSWAQTCIPRTDRYVTLTVASSHPTVTVYVGHPLTAQGVGFLTHPWTFTTRAGRAAVTVPTDVAFTMQPNGQLLGDIVDNHGHLRLLFWVSSDSTTVLRGGRVASLALGSWNIGAISMTNPALQVVLHQDERLGWARLLRVRPSAWVVGDGEDTWLALRMKQSFDLFTANGTGGNIVFAVTRVITKTPSMYANPPDGCASP